MITIIWAFIFIHISPLWACVQPCEFILIAPDTLVAFNDFHLWCYIQINARLRAHVKGYDHIALVYHTSCTFWSDNDTAHLHPIILTLGFNSILLNGYWACQNLLGTRLYWSSKLLPFLTGNLKSLTATKKYLTATMRSQKLLKSADILRFCIKPLTRQALMMASQGKHVIKTAVDQ